MSLQTFKNAATPSRAVTRQITAVVVSSGLMQKTVKVRIGIQKWNGHIRKHFSHRKHLLVHDPASSLRTGDIISISPGTRFSKTVHHVVNTILAPFGEPIESRPPIPSREEREKERVEKREAKRERKRGREEGEGKEGVEEGVNGEEGEGRGGVLEAVREMERGKGSGEGKLVL